MVIPEEILQCFTNEDAAIYEAFLNLSEGAQKRYLDWIYGDKKEETRVARIVKMMEELAEREN